MFPYPLEFASLSVHLPASKNEHETKPVWPGAKARGWSVKEG